MVVCQMAVNDLQSGVDADEAQIVIEKCEANGCGGDQLQQLRFLSRFNKAIPARKRSTVLLSRTFISALQTS